MRSQLSANVVVRVRQLLLTYAPTIGPATPRVIKLRKSEAPQSLCANLMKARNSFTRSFCMASTPYAMQITMGSARLIVTSMSTTNPAFGTIAAVHIRPTAQAAT